MQKPAALKKAIKIEDPESLITLRVGDYTIKVFWYGDSWLIGGEPPESWDCSPCYSVYNRNSERVRDDKFPLTVAAVGSHFAIEARKKALDWVWENMPEDHRTERDGEKMIKADGKSFAPLAEISSKKLYQMAHGKFYLSLPGYEISRSQPTLF